ncbi:MAG: AAA family ATPase, partial [Candidatus Thermoplasmatota archaeon]|nr:AAA family ATPase [Candidatus Thermoplasmatota archaeon]
MTGYLDRIGAGKVLLDKAPLSYDWVPPSLVGRDDELGEMAAIFSQIENHETSCQAVMIGPVGSGKTVLTRRFAEDIQRHLEGRRKVVMTHVNCRNHPTGSQVLQQIA